MVCFKICYTSPFRHILTTLACFAMTLALSMREVLAIVLLEMVEPQPSSRSDNCLLSNGLNRPVLDKNHADKFDWTEPTQALILMGFYIGYSISHFASGPIINKYGARWPIFIGMSISMLTTCIIPIVAHIHWVFVFMVRILTGVGQSVLLPGIASLINAWIPLESRSLMATIIYAGSPMGTFLGFYCSPIIIYYYETWHYAYYIWSASTVPWLLLFIINVYSYPDRHPRLSELGSSYFKSDFIQPETNDPMHSRLTICSQIIATFGHEYYLFTLTAFLPKYLNTFLNYEFSDIAVYAATPFMLMYFSGIYSRVLLRWIIEKKNVNEDLLRIIYGTLHNLLASSLILLAFYLDCSKFSIVVGLIHASTIFGGFFYGSFNVLDLSYSHSCITISIVNGCASSSGIVSLGVMVKVFRESTPSEWQFIAWMLLAVALITWCMDLSLTIIKLNMESKAQIEEKRWYQHIQPAIHAEKLEASRLIRDKLKRKQKGRTSP